MIAPLPVDVGGGIVKAAVPIIFAGIEKLTITVVFLFTWRVAVRIPGPKLFVAGCVAVMVVVPAPTMVTTSFLMVATVISELV